MVYRWGPDGARCDEVGCDKVATHSVALYSRYPGGSTMFHHAQVACEHHAHKMGNDMRYNLDVFPERRKML